LSSLSGFLVPGDTVEAVVSPLAFDGLSVFVGEAAISVFGIVAELTFVHRAIGGHELAVAMSHILSPVTVVS